MYGVHLTNPELVASKNRLIQSTQPVSVTVNNPWARGMMHEVFSRWNSVIGVRIPLWVGFHARAFLRRLVDLCLTMDRSYVLESYHCLADS
jgi:hypothetical protein